VFYLDWLHDLAELGDCCGVCAPGALRAGVCRVVVLVPAADAGEESAPAGNRLLVSYLPVVRVPHAHIAG
jgi:hypothetical protein